MTEIGSPRSNFTPKASMSSAAFWPTAVIEITQRHGLHRKIVVDGRGQQTRVKAAHRKTVTGRAFRKDQYRMTTTNVFTDRPGRSIGRITMATLDEQRAAATRQKTDHRPTPDIGLGEKPYTGNTAEDRNIQPGNMIGDPQRWTPGRLAMDLDANTDQADHPSQPPAPQPPETFTRNVIAHIRRQRQRQRNAQQRPARQRHQADHGDQCAHHNQAPRAIARWPMSER